MKILFIMLFIIFNISYSHAQNTTRLCITTNGNNCISIDSSNPLPTTLGSGTVSSNLAQILGSPVSEFNPIYIAPFSGQQTYSSAVLNQAYTVSGDIYCIIGSATKIVKIKGIRISAVATAGIVGDVSLIIRSSLNTGGGLASVPIIAHDSNNSIATASVNSFTSAPTTGTPVGVIRTKKLAVGTSGNSAITTEGLFQFSVYWDQPIVIRNSNRALCVNVSAFGAGAFFNIDHEHTEE